MRLGHLCYTAGMFTFTGLIIKEEDGYTALCPELDVASWGDTPANAQTMLLEAATLHLEGAFEDDLPYLRPVPQNADPRQTEPDLIQQIFQFQTATISAKGWIVIPVDMRRQYGLNPGERVVSVAYGGVLSIIPRLSNPIGQAAGRFKGKRSLIDALLAERRRERARE